MLVVVAMRRLRISTPRSCQAAQSELGDPKILGRVPASDAFPRRCEQCATRGILGCDSSNRESVSACSDGEN